MEKSNTKRYDCIVAIVIIICFFTTLFLFGMTIASNFNYECKEITDTIFVYRRDTIVILPHQNIEDIKENLNVIKK